LDWGVNSRPQLSSAQRRRTGSGGFALRHARHIGGLTASGRGYIRLPQPPAQPAGGYPVGPRGGRGVGFWWPAHLARAPATPRGSGLAVGLRAARHGWQTISGRERATRTTGPLQTEHLSITSPKGRRLP